MNGQSELKPIIIQPTGCEYTCACACVTQVCRLPIFDFTYTALTRFMHGIPGTFVIFVRTCNCLVLKFSATCMNVSHFHLLLEPDFVF